MEWREKSLHGVWDYAPKNSLEPGTATRLEASLPIRPGTSF